MSRGDEGGQGLPRVVVLMATYNGLPWIDEQVDSILAQRGVDVRLLVSDDGSQDGTVDRLRALAADDPRVEILPRRAGPPGVTANFLHLFTAWKPTDDVYVAFSDQDDIWHEDKLETQVALIRERGVDAVSSNVTSFDSRGRRRLIVKSQPQVRWDHIFEAAGPGSTYVFTPRMHRKLLGALEEVDTSRIGVHDWFLYALTRGVGGTWHIDSSSTVDYRQHGSNVQGEHAGASAFRSRFRHMRSGYYREQFLLTADAVRGVGRDQLSVAELGNLDLLRRELRDRSAGGRLAIAGRWREIRRKPVEGLQLVAACLLGIW